MERTLKLGTAYHGGRFLHQVAEDMRDIARHNMNTVVHMYTHNDWVRRPKLMADIVKASEDAGLEVWMDNWGMDGGPGDKFFWTAIHPECKAVFADGTPTPFKPCFNQPEFRKFTKSWVDAIGETGCKTLFWDEPCFQKSGDHGWSCYCPTCQKLFEERFNKKMEKLNEESELTDILESIANNEIRRFNMYRYWFRCFIGYIFCAGC